MDGLYILFLFLLVYPYVVYPGVLFVLSRVFPSAWRRADIRPPISVIISVYNEEAIIREKLENALQLNYPEELIEILVVSDGSTDMTNQIAASLDDRRVVLKAFAERLGKTACLNLVVPGVKGELIVFTDANSMFPSHALTEMVSDFADEDVGLVTGWTQYGTADGMPAPAGIYTELERLTKLWESRVSSCVGADGAVFAVRKAFYKPLEAEDINDFIIPLQIIQQKKRVILNTDFYCTEKPGSSGARELQRQARITNRTLRAMFRNTDLMNPLKHGTFAFFLLSHKLLRFLVPFFFLGSLVTGFAAFGQSSLVSLLFVAQLLCVMAGLAGAAGLWNNRMTRLSKFFLLTLCAQLMGWWRLLTGRTDTVWTPQR